MTGHADSVWLDFFTSFLIIDNIHWSVPRKPDALWDRSLTSEVPSGCLCNDINCSAAVC